MAAVSDVEGGRWKGCNVRAHRVLRRMPAGAGMRVALLTVAVMSGAVAASRVTTGGWPTAWNVLWLTLGTAAGAAVIEFTVGMLERR